MPSLLELQRRFAAGLGGEAHALDGLVAEHGLRAAQRLQIYRNNFNISLSAALVAVYPVVQQLVGGGFFGYLAHEFTRAFPSRSGNLHDFGAEMGHFLITFTDARELPYLSDVARLEWAWHQTFHSADAPSFPLERLGQVDPALHAQLRFKLHPSAHLLDMQFPVSLIWEANQVDAEAAESVDISTGSEQLLIIRLEEQVQVVRLPAGEFALLGALHQGRAFGEACEIALTAAPKLDLANTLPMLIGNGTLCDFLLPDDTALKSREKNINNA